MWNDPTIKLQIQEYFRQAKNPLSKIEKYEDIFKSNSDIEYGQFTEDWIFES